MVEHHLAKVRVAGSSPVIRSGAGQFDLDSAIASAVAWPRGEAAACKAVYTGSNPVATSTGAIGAAVARFPDTEEVTGSIPVSRTHHPGLGRGFSFTGRLQQNRNRLATSMATNV